MRRRRPIPNSRQRRRKRRQAQAKKPTRPRKRVRIATLRLKNAGTQNMPTHNEIEADQGSTPPPKETAAPLTGDLALVKEAIDLARKAKTDEATAARQDHRPGGAETGRMVHPAPRRDEGEFQPLCRLHRGQPGMAERCAATPAGGSAAVAGSRRCNHGSWLHGRSAGQRQGQTGAGARHAH